MTKAKVMLEQAMKAQRGSRGIGLLFMEEIQNTYMFLHGYTFIHIHHKMI
jgi:hypothetical protein